MDGLLNKWVSVLWAFHAAKSSDRVTRPAPGRAGPFRRVEELLAVRGITKKRLEKIRPLVTVKPPAPVKDSPSYG